MALILCPRCRHLLDQQNTTRQPCRNCGGVYVRREAMTPLLEELHRAGGRAIMLSPYRSSPTLERIQPEPPPLEPEARYLACPYCARRMNRITIFANFKIVVDMCLNHGVWFDADELARASDYLGALQRTDVSGEETGEEDKVELLLGYFFADGALREGRGTPQSKR
jgi:Zn-finger nucleic acid-binding protein